MTVGYYNGNPKDVGSDSINSDGQCLEGLKMVLVIGEVGEAENQPQTSQTSQTSSTTPKISDTG